MNFNLNDHPRRSAVSVLFTLTLLALMIAGWTCSRLKAQTTVLQQPDCQSFVNLVAAGSTTTYDNRFTGCSYWSFSYGANGFSALTITVQSAPNTSGASNPGVPGSFSTFGGTTVEGSNPATATTSAFWIGTGYYPFMRVSLSGLTGSGAITGNLYGWRQRPGGSGGSGSGCPDPCTVIQPTAASLNATVVGAGVAGTPAGGVVSVQGVAGGTAVPVSFSPSGTQNVNLTQVGSTSVVTGGVSGSQGVGGLAASGATAAGNPVAVGGTFLTTQPTVTNGQAVTAQYSARGSALVTPGVEGFPVTVGSVPSNQSVNLAQVGGTSTVTGGVAGSQGVGGLAAAGAAISGNPVLVGGSDGTNARAISTNSSGQVNIVCISGCGGGAAGGSQTSTSAAAADDVANTNDLISANVNVTNPYQKTFPFVFDGTTWDRLRGNSAGGVFVQGPIANGSSAGGNPVQMAGTDGTTVRTIRTSTVGGIALSTNSHTFGDISGNTQDTPQSTGGGAFTFKMYPFVYNSASWDRWVKCQTSTAISLSSSGTTQIIAASGATTIQICHLSLAAASAVDIQLKYGTGTNCGTGTGNVSGVYYNVTSLALDFVTPSMLALPLSQALCINLGASVNVGGVINYVKF